MGFLPGPSTDFVPYTCLSTGMPLSLPLHPNQCTNASKLSRSNTDPPFNRDPSDDSTWKSARSSKDSWLCLTIVVHRVILLLCHIWYFLSLHVILSSWLDVEFFWDFYVCTPTKSKQYLYGISTKSSCLVGSRILGLWSLLSFSLLSDIQCPVVSNSANPYEAFSLCAFWIGGLRVNPCSRRLVKESWIQSLIASEFLGLEEPKKLTLASFLLSSSCPSSSAWLPGISSWGWWFWLPFLCWLCGTTTSLTEGKSRLCSSWASGCSLWATCTMCSCRKWFPKGMWGPLSWPFLPAGYFWSS